MSARSRDLCTLSAREVTGGALAGYRARLGAADPYLLNPPQFIIAYFAALKCGATVTPISPVYTSHEVRYQLEDSGARAIVCQDILHDKVMKSGAPLDLIVVTSIAEYLPPWKRLLGRGPLARF